MIEPLCDDFGDMFWRRGDCSRHSRTLKLNGRCVGVLGHRRWGRVRSVCSVARPVLNRERLGLAQTLLRRVPQLLATDDVCFFSVTTTLRGVARKQPPCRPRSRSSTPIRYRARIPPAKSTRRRRAGGLRVSGTRRMRGMQADDTD